MRIVLDTNVVVSAFFWGGAPREVLGALQLGRIGVIASDALLAELAYVVNRPKFVQRLADIELETADLLAQYRALVSVVDAPRLEQSVCDDPDDDAVLECALAGNADLIVSGDDDLLRLGEFHGVRIVTARAFLDSLPA